MESYKKNGKKGKKMKIKSDYLHFITFGTFIWIINSWSAEDVSVFFCGTASIGNLTLMTEIQRYGYHCIILQIRRYIKTRTLLFDFSKLI